MNLALAFTDLVELARPHFLAVGLIVARLAPIALLCPILGGRVAPQTVKLSLCLGLALHVHFAGDVTPGPGTDVDAFSLLAAFARELLCGAAIGFVAALPFDAARMGGRFLDTFRGANAEASLPATGSTEAATGHLLYQLLCALVFAGPLYRVLAFSILSSYRVLPLGLGGPSLNTSVLIEVAVARATSALATGLAIGAPAAAVSLLVDGALAIAARVAPSLNQAALGAPVKLLLGAAAILLALGTASNRLLGELAEAANAMGTLGAAVRLP